MKTSTRLTLLASLGAAALGTGCVRLNPLYGGPAYHFREQSKDGKLNQPNEGSLDPQGTDAYAQGFRFDVPAPGAMIVSVKPGNPAAQLDLDVYGDGKVALATTSNQPDKKLTVQDLQPGSYYVVVHESWRSGEASSFRLLPIFKPNDPDAQQTACKTQGTARDLQADKGYVEDGVDYSAQRRTCWWKIPLEAEGALSLKFNNNGKNLSAEFVPAAGGAPEKIDPIAGLKKDDLAAGDYFVKVYANDAGDAGRYSLTTTFKQGDTCKNGGPACNIEGAEDLKLPSDSKSADVDYSKSKQFHFYKVSFTQKGKLTITFKVLQPSRGSKVAAYFMKSQDDDGERVAGTAMTRDIDNPGDYFIRVQAPEQGDYGKYAISTVFQPDQFIPAEVLEIGRSPCMLTVSAGSNQQVRAGLSCTVVDASGAVLDTCVVDQAFPNLSKVKPMSPRCRIPANAKVQIAVE